MEPTLYTLLEGGVVLPYQLEFHQLWVTNDPEEANVDGIQYADCCDTVHTNDRYDLSVWGDEPIFGAFSGGIDGALHLWTYNTSDIDHEQATKIITDYMNKKGE